MTDPSAPRGAPGLEESYRHVLDLARSHYENFPTASRFLPAELQPHVAAIYAFAREADDFADEPRWEGRRLEELARWGQELERAAEGRPSPEPLWVALAHTISSRGLPIDPFRDLLTAFRRDVEQSRHPDWASLLDYSRYSANPVGRLVLLLFGYRDPELHRRADALTTALQLANFWQDVGVDLGKDRIYLPQEDLRRFGVSEEELRSRRASRAFRDLLAFEVERTRALFAQGWAVTEGVGKELALQLRLTWHGGSRILDKIEEQGFDTLARRPKLGKLDYVALLARAASPGRPARARA